MTEDTFWKFHRHSNGVGLDYTYMEYSYFFNKICGFNVKYSSFFSIKYVVSVYIYIQLNVIYKKCCFSFTINIIDSVYI
jgi:hypothetical protein